MKKSYIIMGLALLLAIAGSCKKNKETETSSFTASIEVDDNDRTSLDGNKVYWSTGDVITVYNDNTSHTYTLSGNGPTQLGTFTTTGGLQPTTSSYWGVYPNNSCTSLNRSNDQFTFSFDASSQTYVEGGFSDELNPMAGKNTNSSYPNRLYFQNAFSILKINATGNDCDITSIELTTNDNSYALTGTYVYSYGSQTLTQSSGSGNIITLSCPGVKLTSTAKSFNIVVPPCALSNGFTITFKNGNSTVDDPFSVTAAQVSSNYTIASNKVFQANMNVELSGIKNYAPAMNTSNWTIGKTTAFSIDAGSYTDHYYTTFYGIHFSTSISGEAYVNPIPNSFSLTSGHKYYVRFWTCTKNYSGSTSYDLYLPVNYSAESHRWIKNEAASNYEDKWQRHAVIFTSDVTVSDAQMRIDFNASNQAERYIADIMIIDLTEAGLASANLTTLNSKPYFSGVTPTW